VVSGWLAQPAHYQRQRQRLQLHRLRTDPQLVVEDLLHG
jgi:hypothetical protein